MENSDVNPPPAPHVIPAGADLDRYMLHSVAEIRQLLREIGENTDLLTISFDGSGDFVLTSIISVSDTAVIIDAGAREEVNRRLLASTRLQFITSRDKIKVQWKANRIEDVRYQGKPAFRIAIPQSVLRLQRREYYRLTAPVARPIMCILPCEHPQVSRRMEFEVADISVGGLALHGPIDRAGFEIGRRYENCEIPLPEIGVLVVTLTVANVFEVTLRNGNSTLRSGCAFVNLQGKMLAMLQKYINQVEREKRERLARFA